MRGTVVLARTPGSADVMGGIVEDGGSLVLTTTLALAMTSAIWRVAGDQVRVHMTTDAGDGSVRQFSLPITAFDVSVGGAEAVLARCREAGCEWAAPTCLTLRQAIADGVIPKPDGGLMILLHSEFPPDADLGNHWVQAAATIDGLCRLSSPHAERLQKSRVCAEAMVLLTGLHNLRTPMTALCGPPDGALLQLRFYPKAQCETLELPPGVVIKVAKTRLTRPTTRQRLIDTRVCAEMGRHMIAELKQLDGMGGGPAADRLAAITPADYVGRYRDRLPSKITGKGFIARFGTLRGLNGSPSPRGTYKVRSRAEHYIYENYRVQEFAAGIARARRSASAEALVRAGQLMYASHWSHSQRCGIGGVEADQLVNAIRAHGPEVGLFGAKVTAGGEGGELVVLMRDDEWARQALKDAIVEAEATSKQTIRTYGGPMAGAEFFQPPDLDGVLELPRTA
ncbi:MAG: hypothetical protein JXQ75_01365 [Phycisphaerae bacterium]|nr:hypothetical protein [Phycisphaerae bacterium]